MSIFSNVVDDDVVSKKKKKKNSDTEAGFRGPPKVGRRPLPSSKYGINQNIHVTFPRKVARKMESS